MDFGWLVVALLIIGLIIWWKTARGGKPAASSRSRQRGNNAFSLGVTDFASQWQAVEERMAQPGLDSTRSAIFEADKLLDIALRQAGCRGETMGERLKSARSVITNQVVYQGLWEAHKMRNALAHELGFELPKSLADRHIQQFKAGLRYLKVLR